MSMQLLLRILGVQCGMFQVWLRIWASPAQFQIHSSQTTMSNLPPACQDLQLSLNSHMSKQSLLWHLSISSPPWFKPLLSLTYLVCRSCSEPLHPACDGHGARKPISTSCMKKWGFAIWNHCESLRSNGVQSGARMYCSWMEWRLSACCGSVRDPNSSFHKSQTVPYKYLS